MTKSDIMDSYYDPKSRKDVFLKIINIYQQTSIYFSFIFVESRHANLLKISDSSDDKKQEVEEEAGPSNWFQRLIQWINPPTPPVPSLVFDDDEVVDVKKLIIQC